MNPDRSHRIISTRLQLNVAEWGPKDAPPLFLQHGGRDHCCSWDAVAAAFAGEYRVIAPDLWGHGDSDRSGDGDYHPTDLFYDITTIFNTLDLPRPAL